MGHEGSVRDGRFFAGRICMAGIYHSSLIVPQNNKIQPVACHSEPQSKNLIIITNIRLCKETT